jgi:tripartite-type tricarboxylate transporter receptor subunit TctC
MTIGKVLVGTLCASALAAASGTALAQDFPNRPVRLVLPFATGGSTDAIAWMVGQKDRGAGAEPADRQPGARR